MSWTVILSRGVNGTLVTTLDVVRAHAACSTAAGVQDNDYGVRCDHQHDIRQPLSLDPINMAHVAGTADDAGTPAPSVFTPATDAGSRPTASKSKKVDISLKIVQFNGQSMRDAHRRGAKGRPRLARLSLVRDQFHKWGAHFVGLQEGRNEAGS